VTISMTHEDKIAVLDLGDRIFGQKGFGSDNRRARLVVDVLGA